MTISIVIPVQERVDRVWRCFLTLAALPELPEHEIVIVDDGAAGLRPLLERLSGDVTSVRSGPHAGFAIAAGVGIAHATGDTIVILRGTPEVGADWLGPLVAALDAVDVAVAVSARTDVCNAHAVSSPAFAVRRGTLATIGGLPRVPDELVLAALTCDTAACGRTVVADGSTVSCAATEAAPSRRALGVAPELSIVIPTLETTSRRTRRCLAAIAAATTVPHEVVIADNGASPQGFTAPVNAALRATSGGYIVVMNDDVEPLPGWWPPLREALDAGASVVFPSTIDGPTRRDFSAWCFGMRRDGLERFAHAPGELFDPQFSVWYQDSDLLVRLIDAGHPPRLVRSSEIHHGRSETVNTDDPELRAWIRRQVVVDRKRFLHKHPETIRNGIAGDLGTTLGTSS